MKIKHLDHINLTVKNLKESMEFYERVFGFKLVEKGENMNSKWAIIKNGDAMLCIYEHPELREPESYKTENRKFHGINHFSFRILDPVAWLSVVKKEKVYIDPEDIIEWPNSLSWYVLDPNGYSIEVVYWKDDVVNF